MINGKQLKIGTIPPNRMGDDIIGDDKKFTIRYSKDKIYEELKKVLSSVKTINLNHGTLYVTEDPNGQYNKKLIDFYIDHLNRNFGIILDEEYFIIAIKYGDYHSIDNHRKKSGEWVISVIKSEFIRRRDIGELSDDNRYDIEKTYREFFNSICCGDWKDSLRILKEIKENSSLVDSTISSLCNIVESYIDSYY